MNCGTVEILLMTSVLLGCVAFVCILMSFIGVSTNVNSEAARTLTQDDIVSLRVLTLRPDRLTCLRIRSLGCVGRRRGCCGGRCKVKPIHPIVIPTVTGRRMNNDHTDKTVPKRRRCLITAGRQPSYNDRN